MIYADIKHNYAAMKTLLFLQTNSIASKETVEFVLSLAKDLNANVKFLHVHYPDVLYAASLTTNTELFQTPINKEVYPSEEINRTEAYMRELKADGKVDNKAYFEYFTGSPEIILRSKFLAGEFDMIALRNEFTTLSMNPYQLIKNIIKNIECPIWVIPEQPYKGISSALYATDYQEGDVNSIKLLTQTLGDNLQKITLLHLADQVGFYQKIMSIGFKTYIEEQVNKPTESLILSTHDKKTIPSYFTEAMQKGEYNFIVALKENKNLFQKVFYRSFTTKLLKGTDELVLILHTKNTITEASEGDDIII